MTKKITGYVALILIVCLLPIQIFATTIQPRKEFSVIMALCATERNWSSNSDSSVFGHAFLTFHNESDFTVRVGHMSLQSGESLTVGTFPKRAHDGIWYNIEACDQPDDVYAIEYVLTEAELEEVNMLINSHNSYNLLTNNCTHFACGIWNDIMPNNQHVSIGNPQYVVDGIRMRSNHFEDYTLPSKPLSSVAYHTVSGVTYDPSGVS